METALTFLVIFGVTFTVGMYIWIFFLKDIVMEKRLSDGLNMIPTLIETPVFKYGLQFDPVKTMSLNLPEVSPLEYMWEIKVLFENDEYGLSVGLYNMRTETIDAERVANLSYFYKHANSEECVKTHEVYELLGKSLTTAQINDRIIMSVIAPMAEWAKSLMPAQIAPAKKVDLDYLLTPGLAKQHNIV